ncbi:unnamed protein product [Camellia sinensis]
MASKRHLQSLFNRICRESRIIRSFGALSEKTMPSSSQHLINLEYECSAHKGHCHPKIVKALLEQAERLTLSSRAFYNDRFPIFAEHLTSMFGYEMVLPMNTGAEGVETALKLARKWGYEKKKIPKDE